MRPRPVTSGLLTVELCRAWPATHARSRGIASRCLSHAASHFPSPSSARRTRLTRTGGRYKSNDIPPRIGERQIAKNFTGIRVPVLALFEFPRNADDYPRPGEYLPQNEQERAAMVAF